MWTSKSKEKETIVKKLRLNKQVLKEDKEIQEQYRMTVKYRYNAIAKAQYIN